MTDLDKLTQLVAKALDAPREKLPNGYYYELKEHIAQYLVDNGVVLPVRCEDCIHRYTEDCPMRYEWSEWHDGWGEYIDYHNDNTEDNYFCCKGGRK